MANYKTAVIAGIGNGTGTGASTARLFASKGYRVALISRSSEETNKLADSINAAGGGEAVAFPLSNYNHEELSRVFIAIESKWPSEIGVSGIRFALWNAGQAAWGALLAITEPVILEAVQVNIVGCFAFSQEVVKGIMNSTGKAEVDYGHRGTLLFTGATAAMRGGNGFSAFAAGKFATRAISQSIAREYGPEGIHVAHAIIDGSIVTDRSKARVVDEVARDAKYSDGRKALSPDSIAKSYWYLHEQDPSAWTQELDLRPAHEKF